ncbi:hypothetical protein, partial [Bacillus cereus group sp. BceL239]
ISFMFKIKFFDKRGYKYFYNKSPRKTMYYCIFLLTNSALSDKNNGYMLTVKYYPYKIIPL